MTASDDGAARVWVVLLACCASQEEANRLASLVEGVSQNEVSDTGALTRIEGGDRLRRLGQSATSPAPELSLEWIIHRFVSVK
jgi:hypothetical protein